MSRREFVVVRCDYCGRWADPDRAVLAYTDADELTAPDTMPGAEAGAYAEYIVLLPACYCGTACSEAACKSSLGIGARG
jgi:hypothetical protein